MIRLPRVPRARRSTIVLVLAVAALAFPLGAWANHQFDDVPTGASYHDDVEALVAAGVTSGCDADPPLYCPTNPVTRAQMAQFLNRLGSLDGATAPSVNARTSQSTDGWSIGCPTNTVLSGGLCFETSTRTADDVFDASEICADVGGTLFGRGQIWKLPAGLELRAADINGDITIANAAEEWTSTFYFDDTNGAQAASYNGSGGLVDRNTLDILPYRCAAIPLQIDNFLFVPLGEEQDGTDARPGADTDRPETPQTEDGTSN